MKRVRKPITKQLRRSHIARPIAGFVAAAFLLVFVAPRASAFVRVQGPKSKVQRAKDQEGRRPVFGFPPPEGPDVRVLSDAEMASYRGSGYRDSRLDGVLPWQRSFRDVNLCNGNLFKSFTDIQVSPARGAGLAFQRTYNSDDDRIGPFGVGWTHAYDIRVEEAGSNQVPRTDFFGGKHAYTRDADGLYTPPPYMFDELSSEYNAFLANGPAQVLSDDQKGMDGTVKHFVSGGAKPDGSPSDTRVCSTITDRHNNQTVLTYGTTITLGDGSTQKLLTRVTDPTSRYLEITWTNLGTSMAPAYRITQVQGPFDGSSNPIYTVTYEYNSDKNLWKVHQDPSGLDRVTTCTYTSYTGTSGTEGGLLASVADPAGHTVSYAYSVPSPATTVWCTSVTEPVSGGTATYTISVSAPGHLGSGVGAWDAVATESGSSTVASGVVSTDLYLRACEISCSNGYTHHINYDSANNVESKTGQLWRPTSASTTVQVANPSVAMTYGPHGNMLAQSVQGTSGTITTQTVTYYDASKYFQKHTVTDAGSHTTTMEYFDDADTSAGNRGEVQWVRDARYGTTGKQFSYTYNSYGQKATETNLNDVETDYTYGTSGADVGNLTQVVQDPGTGTHLHRTTAMAYDYGGRVVSSTDPKSQSSSFTFNALGQPHVATLPDETVTYTYGTNGRTESVQDGRGTTTIAYETGNDRVHSVTDPVTGAIVYSYGLLGERATMELPGGDTWTYHYRSGWHVLPKDDPQSYAPMLEYLEDDLGNKVYYWFDNLGRLYEVGKDIASGLHLHTTYTFDTGSSYNHRGTLTQVKNSYTHPSGMSTVTETQVQNDYTYSDSGNRLTNQVSDNSGPIRTESYGYDALNRLTSVDYDDGETQSYVFDPMGNRTSKSDTTTSTVTESYTYNAANMLTARAGNSYTNDLNGNTTAGGGRANTWDGENRLTECAYTVGGTTTTTDFTYGADGLRRRSVTGSDTTDYTLEGQNAVRTKLNSTVDKTYLTGPRGPEYERDSSGTVLWYLYDGLGSVLGTVNSAGSVVHTRKYDVYGAVRGSTGGSGPKHKWVGHLGHPSEDGIGLVYMRARYMDPVTGTFSSEDSAHNGTNWFVYARCAPTRYEDHDGRFEDEIDRILMNLETDLWAANQHIYTAYDSYLKFKEWQQKYMAAVEALETPGGGGSEAWVAQCRGQMLIYGDAMKSDVNLYFKDVMAAWNRAWAALAALEVSTL